MISEERNRYGRLPVVWALKIKSLRDIFGYLKTDPQYMSQNIKDSLCLIDSIY